MPWCLAYNLHLRKNGVFVVGVRNYLRAVRKGLRTPA